MMIEILKIVVLVVVVPIVVYISVKLGTYAFFSTKLRVERERHGKTKRRTSPRIGPPQG